MSTPDPVPGLTPVQHASIWATFSADIAPAWAKLCAALQVAVTDINLAASFAEPILEVVDPPVAAGVGAGVALLDAGNAAVQANSPAAALAPIQQAIAAAKALTAPPTATLPATKL